MNFKEKKLAIVVLSYNTKKLLSQCLKSLMLNAKSSKLKMKNEKCQMLNLEVIVVDNASTDGSVEWLKRFTSEECIRTPTRRNLTIKSEMKNVKCQMENIKVILNDRNLGFCGGMNTGIRYAITNKADYVMTLNSDTLIKDAFWEPLVGFLEENKEVGVVTPKIYFAPGYEYHRERYKKEEQGKVIWSVGGAIDWDNVFGSNRGVNEIDRGQYDQPAEVDFASGCCLLARSEVWQKLNFLDEKYFMYYEDTDFCQRAKRTGWKVFYVPKSELWHLNAGSSQVGGSLQDYFITRNRLFFGLRFASFRAKLALIRESGRLLINGRKWQKQGVKDFYLKRLGKGSWK